MSKVSEEVILEWVAKKKHIQDRLNRIKKRLKKYSKQEKHFEFRMALIKKYEKENGKTDRK
ncbi:MAG TPA: hypothetical protein VM577_18850 [Anaerovoracaceae bacterium]|nr:hypothetical protein [Anaerovoracaceae bacterium]